MMGFNIQGFEILSFRGKSAQKKPPTSHLKYQIEIPGSGRRVDVSLNKDVFGGPAEMPSPSAALKLGTTPDREIRILLNASMESFVIGRSDECQVQIDNGKVSRIHAIISARESDGQFFLTVNSKNPTLLERDGKREALTYSFKPVPLVDGDRIGIPVGSGNHLWLTFSDFRGRVEPNPRLFNPRDIKDINVLDLKKLADNISEALKAAGLFRIKVVDELVEALEEKWAGTEEMEWYRFEEILRRESFKLGIVYPDSLITMLRDRIVSAGK